MDTQAVTLRSRIAGLVLGFTLTVAAWGATFNQFGPVTGVLKGNASSPQTTAAVYTDIVSMWTSCSSPATKVLMADGNCALPATVTPAALTKVDDTNVTLTLGGTPSTALLQATSITAGWSGTLAASRGGLGMSTVTDDTLAVANGTTWQSKAIPDCDAATAVLQYDTSSNDFFCATNASPAGAALTKTDDTNVTLTLGGAPTTALVNAASVTVGWTGTLAATRGGLGMSTVTDDTVAVANGSAWQSKALTDCDAATSAVRYDTTTNAWGCNTINGATGANPTGTIGLSAVNGSAGTFLRSDGAPALSQAIAPTWTGQHTFTRTASTPVLINGPVAGTSVLEVTGNTTGVPIRMMDQAAAINNQSAVVIGVSTSALNGLTGDLVLTPRTSAAGALRIYTGNGGASTQKAAVENDGGVVVGAPTGGTQGLGTVNATGLFINGVPLTGGTTTTGTFTLTFTGVSSGSCSMKYRLVGSTVFLFNNSGSSCVGTSNATTFTMTGLPSAIQPTRNTESLTIGVDNGAATIASAQIAASGSVITMFAANVGGTLSTFGNNWTASGNKGLAAGWGLVYDLGN
jgi:hypothetical protein